MRSSSSLLLHTLLLTLGCAVRRDPARANPPGCPAAPAQSAPFDTAQWRELSGRFRLVQFDTVNRRNWDPEGMPIELREPDSAFVAGWNQDEERSVRFAKTRRPPLERDTLMIPAPRLVGVEGDGTRTLLNGSTIYRPGVIVIGSCRRICLDGSPTYLTLTHRTATGFRGEWVDFMTGIGVLLDPDTKRRLPHPAGYFCLIRER